jgi:hypothetical protein
MDTDTTTAIAPKNRVGLVAGQAGVSDAPADHLLRLRHGADSLAKRCTRAPVCVSVA